MTLHTKPSGPLRGDIAVPGDKSISHRALLLSAIGSGSSCLRGMLLQGDCAATVGMLQALGITVETLVTQTIVHGKGLRGLSNPNNPIDCLRSGTTMRLGSGLLAPQTFHTTLSGDSQLLKRPMRRITEPLSQMGARITCSDKGTPPLSIEGADLHGCDHQLSVASAQVKSCLLLAGLYASGQTTVQEPGPSRDHTERMLRARGIELGSQDLCHKLETPASKLDPVDMTMPGDFSSASYLIVAATLIKGSSIRIRDVGINPTRTGLLDVLQAMGARIALENVRDSGGEPIGDIVVESAMLKGTEIGGSLVPRMIDEFPVLALAAACAEGNTTVHDASELRHKESDRIATVTKELSAMGATIEATADGFHIKGREHLQGAQANSHGDHRLAMTLTIAGLTATGETTIIGTECIPDSFPGFIETLKTLGGANIL